MFLITLSKDDDGAAPPMAGIALARSPAAKDSAAPSLEEASELKGRTILVVEDEGIVAMSVEQALLDLGCAEVVLALNLQEGLALAATRAFDAAILDINLRGTEVFPLAELLARRATPFVFASGYGPETIRPDLRNHPLIGKPYQPRDLRDALKSLLRNR